MARQSTSRVLIGSAVAALYAVTLLSGCGGSAKAVGPVKPTLSPILQGDPTAVVAAAAGRTATSGGAGVTMTVPVLQEGKLASVNGAGVLDFSAHRLKLTVPNAAEAEERKFGRKLYVLLPEEAGQALGGKKWVSLDLDTTPAKSPDPFNLFAYDPAQLVMAETAIAQATLVGPESVRGINATHFTGVIDPGRLASAGLEPTFTKQFRSATKGMAAPTDIWLDDSGLVRRMAITLPPPGGPVPAGSSPLTTVELYDFGTADVSFPEPPPAAVVGVNDLGSLPGTGD